LLLAELSFLFASELLADFWWILLLSVLGLAFSFGLPRRFRVNATYLVMVAAFITAGIRIAALREEMNPAVFFDAYEKIVLLMVAITAFKVFTRLDLLFMLGAAAAMSVAGALLAAAPLVIPLSLGSLGLSAAGMLQLQKPQPVLAR
jgi:hypothetical protein